jgi:hypothetical protein
VKNVVKVSCLRVSKAYGEKAIIVAKRIGLLNRDLRIQREQDICAFP